MLVGKAEKTVRIPVIDQNPRDQELVDDLHGRLLQYRLLSI